MTKTDARAWLNLFGDTPDELRCSCVHGHGECSTTHKGECLDDVIQAAVTDAEEICSPN